MSEQLPRPNLSGPRGPDPYGFAQSFEAAIVRIACSRPPFFARVGREIDPELLNLEPAKFAMRAIHAFFREHGHGPSSPVLVIQRLKNWMNEGRCTHEKIEAVVAMLDTADERGLPSEDDLVKELVPILARRIRDEAVRAAIDSFSKGGDLAKVLELEHRARRLDSPVEMSSAVVSRQLSAVRPRPVEWLWPRRIPFGALSVLDGDPGLGKSTLTADLAARVSTGAPMPDIPGERDPGTVVVMSAEDSAEHTIGPRLRAAGGDCSRIHVIDGVLDGRGRQHRITLPDDTDRLADFLEKHRARLLVIDPFLAFLSGRVDSHRDQDVRSVLAALAKLASDLGMAILIVRHLNKGSHDRALYRGGGSIGIIGAARAGLLVGRDPRDENARVLAPMKNNLAGSTPSLRFKIVPSVVELEDTRVDTSRVEWLGEDAVGADELLQSDRSRPRALGKACEFLKEQLRGGPKSAVEVEAAANAAGISDRTLERARADLHVRAEKRAGVWMLELDERPAEGRQPPSP